MSASTRTASRRFSSADFAGGNSLGCAPISEAGWWWEHPPSPPARSPAERADRSLAPGKFGRLTHVHPHAGVHRRTCRRPAAAAAPARGREVFRRCLCAPRAAAGAPHTTTLTVALQAPCSLMVFVQRLPSRRLCLRQCYRSPRCGMWFLSGWVPLAQSDSAGKDWSVLTRPRRAEGLCHCRRSLS